MRHYLPIILAATAALLPSCESLNQPLTEGRISPLDVAGTTARAKAVAEAGPAGMGGFFQPGEYVATNSPSTPFFKKKPAGNATADQMLPLNEPLKFLADEDAYFKVETSKGEVGYVPALMVAIPMDNPDPLPGIIDLPELPPLDDPGGLPPLPDPDSLVDPAAPPADGAEEPEPAAPAAPKDPVAPVAPPLPEP